MIKTTALALVMGALCFATTTPAQARGVREVGKVGVGFGMGTFATGFSAKYNMDPKMSLQGNVGWWRGGYYCTRTRCWGGGESMAVSGDLIFEMPTLGGNKNVSVAWELGVGAGIGFSDSFANSFGIGVSGIVGLQLNIDVLPLDVVVEYRPGIHVLPNVGFDLVNFTGHIRYYF